MANWVIEKHYPPDDPDCLGNDFTVVIKQNDRVVEHYLDYYTGMNRAMGFTDGVSFIINRKIIPVVVNVVDRSSDS